MRFAATATLALAAASTGVVVPTLKALVEQSGGGRIAAGMFVAAHVLGGIVGATGGARALRLTGSARSLAAAALAASVVVTLAIAGLDSLAPRIALRFLDGGCHVLALTALIAAATTGDAAGRASRAIWLGVAIVLGVASGLGIGAGLGSRGLGTVLGRPEAALVVAALLSAAALALVIARVAGEHGEDVGSKVPAGAPGAAGDAARGPRRGHAAVDRPPAGLAASDAPGIGDSAPDLAPGGSHDRGPLAPALLAFGERFIFGALTTSTPFLAAPSRVGMVLGVFMTVSIIALPIARRYALTWGPRRLALRSAVVFIAGLAPCGAVDVFASTGAALVWAVVCGAAAGALYASALVLAARSAVLEDRVRDMAALHAGGGAGHALGALSAGVLASVLPGALVVALPGTAILAAAAVGVWTTVPDHRPRSVDLARRPSVT